eukprot:2122641-Amphidinium_carterae.1
MLHKATLPAKHPYISKPSAQTPQLTATATLSSTLQCYSDLQPAHSVDSCPSSWSTPHLMVRDKRL